MSSVALMVNDVTLAYRVVPELRTIFVVEICIFSASFDLSVFDSWHTSSLEVFSSNIFCTFLSLLFSY